jgi:hypothetical protein
MRNTVSSIVVLKSYLGRLGQQTTKNKPPLPTSRQGQSDRPMSDRFDRLYQKSARLRSQSDARVGLLLGKEFEISDSLRLQIMTPALRGFPHVIGQFQNLYELGYRFLRVQANAHAVKSRRAGHEIDINAINGNDFDAPGRKPWADILHKNRLKKFLECSGLTEALIYPDTHRVHGETMQTKHGIEALYLLIGAVYKDLGSEKAERFVVDRVLGGKNGLVLAGIV